MVDVFISYARENQGFAQRIADAVRGEGYSVFWDDDLPPHLSYGEVITEKISRAKAAIVVWSHDAAESEWVRAEADLARTQKKLIQTSIDDRLPPMPFNQIQFAAIGDWNGDRDHPGWRKVRASLAALVRGEATAGTAPLQPAPLAHRPSPPVAASRESPQGSRWAVIAIVGLALLATVAGVLMWMTRAPEVDPDLVAGAPAPAAAPGSATTPRPASAAFTQAAVIDDPDGYTNVRSGPAESFPVIARVNRGELFTTYPQSGDWWQVRTASSRVGFMARSRIRVIESAAEPQRTEPEPALAERVAEPASTPVATAPPQIFADSSRRRLTPREVARMSAVQLRLARNEIFARHGRPFRDPRLQRHFERYSWYNPRPGPIALNPIEQANVRLLQLAEARKPG